MSTTTLLIDTRAEQRQQSRNLLDTIVLVGGMAVLTATAAFLILGWLGLLAGFLAVGLLALAAPSLPPDYTMRLYRAKPMDRRNGRDVYAILNELVARAGMPVAPQLHVVPSLTLNAFSAGTPDRAAIAITEGLLRKLSLRQMSGVLAHELSHIRNNDLRLMSLADAMTRVLQVLSWIGLALIAVYIPQYFAGEARIPWAGAFLLYLAPMFGSTLQLALSRTREYEADIDAVSLTGDPEGLATALGELEHPQGHIWEDLVFPNCRRVPQPSLLRTHPHTPDRLQRLAAIRFPGGESPMAIGAEAPRVSLVGLSPSQMRPRYRFPGLWF
jgi:heat shock protein HtpX